MSECDCTTCEQLNDAIALIQDIAGICDSLLDHPHSGDLASVILDMIENNG